jgi:Flp pilus assembly pilin Flp
VQHGRGEEHGNRGVTAPPACIACHGDALQEDAMKALMTVYHSLRRNDEGQDLLEYALLVALIAIVAVGAVTTAGQTVADIFNDIAGQI